MIIPLLIALLAVGLIAGDAGSSSAPGVAGSDGPATSAGGSQGTTDAVTPASEVGKRKPRVQAPKGPPPSELEVTDLVAGAGAAAKEGDVVTVAYLVLLQKSGKEAYSSWGSRPLSFELGKKGSVTAGWQQGIVGMRVGGRRELVAPADLSYGKTGNPPAVGPNEALVSVIDLLKVKPAPAPEQSPRAGSQ